MSFPRRIVLSRKGFDSAAGGCPSPVIDGRRISLPIPEPGCGRGCRKEHVRYGELGEALPGVPLWQVVEQLSKGRVRARDCVHLDPDIRPELRPAKHRGNPAMLFGQVERAQAELRHLQPGDLFLFYGLFRDAEAVDGRVRFLPSHKPQHHIWGWLQVGAILKGGDFGESHAHHPHAYRDWGESNTLYEAAAKLSFISGLPGAGIFARPAAETILTDSAGATAARWRLPRWLAQAGMTRFDFRGRDAEGKPLWRRDGGTVVSVAARCKGCGAASYGQECVAETAGYEREAKEWL